MAKLSKDELMKAIEEMPVLELSDLVKALEEKFGVSAAAAAVHQKIKAVLTKARSSITVSQRLAYRYWWPSAR